MPVSGVTNVSNVRPFGRGPVMTVDGVGQPDPQMLAQAVAGMHHALSLFDAEGCVTYDNACAGAAFAGEETSFASRFEDPREAADAWRRAMEGRVFRTQCRLLSNDGPRWYSVEVYPVTDAQGRKGVALTGQDITNRIMVERTLSETTERLSRSVSELDQFAYVTSHDLREPLRNVVSYLNLLTRRLGPKVDPESAEFIRYAVEGAMRLDVLTKDLLDYVSAGTSGKISRPVSLEKVAAAARQQLAPAVAATGAEFEIQSLPTVGGVPEDLERVFVNLFANALKYRTPDQPPRVQVFAEREDAAWVICVRDNGLGIDPRFSHRIFLLFQRLHGRDVYDGTGVGLAICHKVIERHGGRIWVESAPGRGAAFFFTLPTG